MIEHRGPISGVATGPADLVGTAGYDNLLILWRGRTAVARAHHDHLVNQCAFDRDGRRLVSASSDYTARIWSVDDLRLLAVLGDHEDDVEMAVFDPAGTRVATASRDHRLRVFTVEGTLLHRLEGHQADVISVAWTEDGEGLVSSSDDGTVRRWDARTGALVEVLDLGGSETDTVVVGPGGQLFAGNDRGEIIRIHGGTTQRIPAHRAGIKRLAIDPHGGLLASSGYDHVLRVWTIDGNRLEPRCSSRIPPVVWARSVTFDHRGRVVMGTFGSSYAVFDPEHQRWGLEGVHDTAGLNAVTVLRDEVCCVGDAGRVWRGGLVVAELGSLCNFLVPWGDRLVTGGHLGRLFDVQRGVVLHEHRSPLNCAVVLDGGDLLVGTYTGEGLRLRRRGRDVALVEVLPLHEQAVKSMAVHGRRVFSVSAAGEAGIHEIDGSDPPRRLPDAHDRIANGVCALPDGRFASVSRDRRLRLWEGEHPRVVPTPHEHSVKCVTVTTNGRFVATGCYDGTIGFYELERDAWATMLRPTYSGISMLHPAREPDAVLASSYDGCVHRLDPSGVVDCVHPSFAGGRGGGDESRALLRHMMRCLELADRGRGDTWPNPVVGCVIVRDGETIAEGWHRGPGLPHAEVEALVRAGERARGATLVVNLEPCCHHGRTPPCTDAVIAAGVQRVVVGMRDPNPLVDGGGLAQLRAHGIEVVTGVVEELCSAWNEDFLRWVDQQRRSGGVGS